jgi:DNA-binding SARP family transcriptional activator
LLVVKLLGQFDVRLDGTPIEISGRPAQSLLAYLILRPGIAFRREKLAGLLWPDATEANARNNLRNALWRLRQALGTGQPSAGRDYFLADNLTLGFDAEAEVGVDVAVLEGVRAAEPMGNDTADGLIASVSAYRGELLPGFYEEWVAPERERLQAIFEHKMGLLLEHWVAAARWPEVRDWGERWIALGSTPEPAYRALMSAHAGLGDVSQVAAVYARCVEALREQLGVEPSGQTRLLYERLSKGGMNPGRAAAIQSPEPARQPVPEPPAPGVPPFKGLQHFDEADAPCSSGANN